MKASRRHVIKRASAGALAAVFAPYLIGEDSAGTMPVLFVGHGSPMNAIQDNAFSNSWKQLGRQIPKPKAILCLSAHWVTRGETRFTDDIRPRIIYDMRGFPDELYQVQYPAPGNPQLANQLHQLVGPGDSASRPWGLDHGTWSVLVHMFPQADIPVVQMSLDYDMPFDEHLEMGQQLAFLRKQGVLIMGSGNIVHNLMARTSQGIWGWAQEFSNLIAAQILSGKFHETAGVHSLGQITQLAHPTYEHFLPLLPVLGAVQESDRQISFNREIVSGSLDMQSWLFQSST